MVPVLEYQLSTCQIPISPQSKTPLILHAQHESDILPPGTIKLRRYEVDIHLHLHQALLYSKLPLLIPRRQRLIIYTTSNPHSSTNTPSKSPPYPNPSSPISTSPNSILSRRYNAPSPRLSINSQYDIKLKNGLDNIRTYVNIFSIQKYLQLL